MVTDAAVEFSPRSGQFSDFVTVSAEMKNMFRIIALLVAISLITGTGYAQPGKAYKCPNVNGHERQVITSVELSLGASLPITYANAGFRLGDAYQVLRKPGIVVGGTLPAGNYRFFRL